jgi:hypothetical protein
MELLPKRDLYSAKVGHQSRRQLRASEPNRGPKREVDAVALPEHARDLADHGETTAEEILSRRVRQKLGGERRDRAHPLISLEHEVANRASLKVQ